MKVELIYLANEQNSFHQSLELDKDCSVQEAIQQSNLFKEYPDLTLDFLSVGIFSQKVELTQKLKDGERIEIYRDLTISPMDKRRLLASKRK